MESTSTLVPVLMAGMALTVKTTSMNVALIRVSMVEHALIKSTDTLAAVHLDILVTDVKVCILYSVISTYTFTLLCFIVFGKKYKKKVCSL